jgi:hypothetical protein
MEGFFTHRIQVVVEYIRLQKYAIKYENKHHENQ